MFIITAKLPKKRLIAGLLTLACCLAVVVTALALSAGSQAVSASAEVKGIRHNDDRIAFLNGLGWQVSPQPIATEELLLPDSFDDSYAPYLTLQKEQGFDLSRYAGKRVKRYTYEVTNYPTGEQGIQVSLLLYRHTVVGGEVLSPTTGGFLHGLIPPDGTLPPEGTEPPDENTGLILGQLVSSGLAQRHKEAGRLSPGLCALSLCPSFLNDCPNAVPPDALPDGR